MTAPRIGSLFSGVGAFDLAAMAVLGGEVAWHCEIDPAGCKVLAHRWLGVKNLGDVSEIDWSDVEPVDVLTGGFPCSDVSAAGKGLGIAPGTRSGLWTQMARAIKALRPRLVVIENVRGLTWARASGNVEPCPWCVGDGAGEPVLRAFGAVLGDLAELGFDAEGVGLPASEVGACHERFRIFILAWPADAVDVGRWAAGWDDGVRAAGLEPVTDADADGPGRERSATVSGARGASAGSSPSIPGVGGCGRAAADPDGVGPFRGGGARRGRGGPADDDLAAARAAPDPDGERLPRRPERDGEPVRSGQPASLGTDADRRFLDWGIYGPAVHRWQRVIGRPAPAPTVTGARGGQSLSPLLVEFMMGLPEGWVTGVPGVSRNDALRLLGGAVVPQQGRAALIELLARTAEVRHVDCA